MAMQPQRLYCALIVGLLWSLTLPVWAACPTRTYTYTSGNVINPTQNTTNETNLYNYLCDGVDTYAAGSIATAALADSSVTSAKISDGTIVNADVSSSAAIVYSKLSFSNNIVAGDIASGAVDAGDMATTGTIADDKVFVADSSTAGTWRTVANCTGATSALQYTQATNAFSCGTITAGITGTGVSALEVIRKTADETVNNSTTNQADDELLFSLGASERVYFEFFLKYDSGTTPDFKTSVTVPAGASASWNSMCLATTVTSSSGNLVTEGGAAGQNAQCGGATAGTQVMLRFAGTAVGGGTAGNVTLSWSQATADASDTKILTNSFVWVWRQ